MYIDDKTRKMLIAATVIVAVAIVVIAYVLLTPSCSAQPGGCGHVQKTSSTPTTLLLGLTDPPQVPANATSLVLYYKGVELHKAGASNVTGFITLNGSGSVELLNLTNITAVVGIAKVRSNMTFDSFVLTGASAVLRVNGTSYDVAVPGGQLRVMVPGGYGGSNESVIADLSSSVLQLYGDGNQSFALVPSERVLVEGGVNLTALGNRTAVPMNSTERALIGAQDFTMVLSGAAAAQNGSTMRITASVINTGNRSATLKHLTIYGIMAAETNSSVIFAKAMQAITKGGGGGGPISKGGGGIGTNSTSNKTQNATKPDFGTGGLSTEIARDLNLNYNSSTVNRTVQGVLRFEAAYHNQLNFVVTQGGTMELPFTSSDVEGQGLTLAPGETVNLTFSGAVRLGQSPLTIELIPNETYRAVLVGNNGSYSESPFVVT